LICIVHSTIGFASKKVGRLLGKNKTFGPKSGQWSDRCRWEKIRTAVHSGFLIVARLNNRSARFLEPVPITASRAFRTLVLICAMLFVLQLALAQFTQAGGEANAMYRFFRRSGRGVTRLCAPPFA
jgi:hypothetical protein